MLRRKLNILRMSLFFLFCRISNRKVQRDYYKAMEVVMQRTTYNQFAL